MGYAAVAFMRRGFGRSDGPYEEGAHDNCAECKHLQQVRTSADDVYGALVSLRLQPWVDPDRIVLLGVSSGGLAVLAAASHDPPGVVGAISFRGGRGSMASDQACNPDELIHTLEVVGRRATAQSW